MLTTPPISPTRLVEQRQRLMFSQQALAEKAGLSVGTVSRLERGLGRPTYATIRKLATALEVEREMLLE